MNFHEIILSLKFSEIKKLKLANSKACNCVWEDVWKMQAFDWLPANYDIGNFCGHLLLTLMEPNSKCVNTPSESELA